MGGQFESISHWGKRVCWPASHPRFVARRARCNSNIPPFIVTGKRAPHDHPNVKLKTLDLSEPQSLAGAFEHIDIVYYLVHGMIRGRELYQYEIDLAHALVERLNNSRVSRVIYLGAIQPDATNSEHLLSRKISGIFYGPPNPRLSSCVPVSSSVPVRRHLK